MFEAVDGRLCLLGRMLSMLKAAEGELCLPEVMPGMLLSENWR